MCEFYLFATEKQLFFAIYANKKVEQSEKLLRLNAYFLITQPIFHCFTTLIKFSNINLDIALQKSAS